MAAYISMVSAWSVVGINVADSESASGGVQGGLPPLGAVMGPKAPIKVNGGLPP